MANRVVPDIWLPPGRSVQRIVMHWSAGGYTPSLLDKSHYHFMVDGKGAVHRGVRSPGQYLPHTRNLNTGSVGLSICAMAGAVQGKAHGKFPLLALQWERACQAAADILAAYDLAVTERTVLCHSEVERVYGKKQRGKWDIDVLPFAPALSPAQVHDQMRRKISWYLDTYHGH